MSAEAPKVFVSHAHDDKERFVRGLAEKLRKAGVDAWVDEWELYPGDSIVDKIFAEGLKNANALLVVLSVASLESRWVREELNAGVVERISKGTLLIPVVLDKVQVPVALKNTVWIEIDDTASYEPQMQRILSSIFNVRIKPPLGKPPEFFAKPGGIEGLNKVDACVLELFGKEALDREETEGVPTEDIWLEAERLGVSAHDFSDALQVLEHKHYLESPHVLAAEQPFYSFTLFGFDCYLRTYAFPGTFDSVVLQVASVIVNDQANTASEVAEQTGWALMIAEHVINALKAKNHVHAEYVSGDLYITERYVSLKRLLTDGS